MAIELFGYRIGKIDDDKKIAEEIPSFAPPASNDGAIEIAPGGSYGTFVDLEGQAKNESQLVTKYRELATQFEVDNAIEEIVNEAIIREDYKAIIEINLEQLNVPERVKTKIRDEFKNVTKLLDFNNLAYDLFRRWYIDGRLYYHMMIDIKKPRDGIKELRYIDPRRIRKVREAQRTLQTADSMAKGIVPSYKEYYIYMSAGVTPGISSTHGTKISKDSIAYIHSGLLDQRNKLVLSHLHTAIKPMNQLRILEDAVVIYRLARAPERRIFYIDVGNLPKMKAEQYLRDMMIKHKNKLVYDATTGEIRDDRKFMTMLEDYWLPRREGGKGTEITTLQGGQNLGEMEDVDYFRRKLYKSLKVPITRTQTDNAFNLGRVGEITRDEIKFSKFIDRLRTRFNHLFDIILETQLILRGVMTRSEWKEMKQYIHYDYQRDNYYAELKNQEIINSRLSILQNVDNYVGKYYSNKWVRINVLRQTDEDMIELDREMSEEAVGINPNAEADMESSQQNSSNSQTSAVSDDQVPARKPPMRRVDQMKRMKEVETENDVKEEIELPNNKELSEEEKQLIESMTQVINDALVEEE